MRKNYFADCADIKLKKLSSEFIQQWVIKTTETISSTRTAEMPDYIIKRLPTSGRLVCLNPNQYIMACGVWASDGTLKRIYRGTMEDYNTLFMGKIIEHFDTMQHEMQHKK